MTHRQVHVRRVYENDVPAEGTRVLVDRIWPRGLSKKDAGLDDWAKDVAPSTELRKWYGHDSAKFAEFSRRYRAELDSSPGRDVVDRLRAIAERDPLILLTATKDVGHSHAVVLVDVLGGQQ